MFIEIVAAGIVLMLVWWLFKSGVIWSLLGLLALLILYFLLSSEQSTGLAPIYPSSQNHYHSERVKFAIPK